MDRVLLRLDIEELESDQNRDRQGYGEGEIAVIHCTDLFCACLFVHACLRGLAPQRTGNRYRAVTEGPMRREGNMAQKRLLLVVAAALEDGQGRVLLARRPQGKSMAGLWEFPGGKLHEGETPEAALVRELREELGIEIEARDLEPFAFASHAYEGFHLLMPLYLCRVWQGEPKALEGQELVWAARERLRDYPMPPADVGLVDRLCEWDSVGNHR